MQTKHTKGSVVEGLPAAERPEKKSSLPVANTIREMQQRLDREEEAGKKAAQHIIPCPKFFR